MPRWVEDRGEIGDMSGVGAGAAGSSTCRSCQGAGHPLGSPARGAIRRFHAPFFGHGRHVGDGALKDVACPVHVGALGFFEADVVEPRVVVEGVRLAGRERPGGGAGAVRERPGGGAEVVWVWVRVKVCVWAWL